MSIWGNESLAATIKLKNGYYDTKNKNTIFGTRINSKILNNSFAKSKSNLNL